MVSGVGEVILVVCKDSLAAIWINLPGDVAFKGRIYQGELIVAHDDLKLLARKLACSRVSCDVELVVHCSICLHYHPSSG